MKRLTLQSPLGIAFRLFAFSTLLCAYTCYRAISVSWIRADPALKYVTREISLESGAIRATQWSGSDRLGFAKVAGQSGIYLSIRIPEPLGYQDGILRGMFSVRREHFSRFDSRLTVPIWPLALLTLGPALRFARSKYRERITRRRLRKGCCAECGYDLRASPERCPECGAVRNVPIAPVGVDRIAA